MNDFEKQFRQIIDSLEIDDRPSANRYDELSSIIMQLRAMGEEFGCGVWTASQPQRSPAREVREARMLAVARGLMSNANFLCIDEPSLGLQPSLRHEIFSILRQINDQGKTVLLVEQNIPQIAKLADRIYVMEEGQISFEGNKDEALNNDHLKEIFLGM